MHIGFVFEAIDKNRGNKVAIKRTLKVGNVISREYVVMSMLEGAPNVIQIVDFFYTIDSMQRLIQNIVMEYCENSLEDQLRLAEKTR